MVAIVITIFVLGYCAIAFEHPIKINKTASALLTSVICWTLYALSSPDKIHHIGEQLGEHLSEISEKFRNFRLLREAKIFSRI